MTTLEKKLYDRLNENHLAIDEVTTMLMEWFGESEMKDNDVYIMLTGLLAENETLLKGIEDTEKEEKTVPLTYFYLYNKLGWEKFCDLTGTNYYAKNEGASFNDTEIFNIKITEAEKLNLI
jgi:hypothetical protein